jgi:hypothetical protein
MQDRKAMTTSLTSKIHAGIEGQYQAASLFGTQLDIPSFTKQSLNPISLDSGVAAGQCDTMFCSERTLAASATENLDFAGALTDPLGNSLTFGHIKAIEIEADAANVNNVVVGGTASNQFIAGFGAATHTWILTPGARMIIYAGAGVGWPVVAATGDLLKVANSGSGTSVKYRITAIGTSA